MCKLMKVKKRAVRSTLAWIITVAMMASMFVSLPVFADEEKSYDYNNVSLQMLHQMDIGLT